MATIAIVASPGTHFVSMGALLDAHTRLGEAYMANASMRDYSQPHTRLMLASIDGGPILMAGGRALAVDGSYKQASDVRIVFLPSFQLPDPDRLRDLIEDPRLGRFYRWLNDLMALGIVIGACGAGVVHLAAAGLLDGKHVAVHPRLLQPFKALFPAVIHAPTQPVVRCGTLFTCALDADSPALVVRMLEQAFSPIVSRNLVEREPVASLKAEDDPLLHDPMVAQARTWLHDHFAGKVRIADLAAELNLSHQTLIRRFRGVGSETPNIYLRRVRLDAAATMLAETRRTVSEVGQLVGYTDIPSFRRHFEAAFGLAPSAYRRREGTRRIAAAPAGQAIPLLENGA